MIFTVPKPVCALVSIVVLASFLITPGIISAAETIPPQCAQIFPQLSRVTVSGDSGGVITEEVCNAYLFLVSRYDIGTRSAPCIKTKEQGIGGLNPDFAVRLTKMIKAMDAALGGQVRINSALRPAPRCDSGGNHTYGCAVDLQYPSRPGTSATDPSSPHVKWIDANSNTYKIHLRLRFSPEWNHVEPVDLAACRANRNGNPNIQAATPPPSNPFTSMMAPFTPTSPQCGAGSMLLNGQCIPQQNTGMTSPFGSQPSASGGSGSSAPTSGSAPSSGTTGGNISSPTTGGSISIPSTGSGISLPGVDGSTNTNTNTNSNGGLSAIDLIAQIANPSSTPTTSGTGTAITLISAISGDVAMTTGVQMASSSATNTVILSGAPVQTFTSQDLKTAPVSPEPGIQSTFRWQILESFRLTLLKVLAFLQPFGAKPVTYGSDSPGVVHSE